MQPTSNQKCEKKRNLERKREEREKRAERKEKRSSKNFLPRIFLTGFVTFFHSTGENPLPGDSFTIGVSVRTEFK